MSVEYVREVEEALVEDMGVLSSPRARGAILADLQDAEPFCEMTGPMTMPREMPVAGSIREAGLTLYREGVLEGVRLMQAGLTPLEIQEWIGRLA